MSSEPVYVGVDVSKAKLDVAVLPGAEIWCLPHDATGITSLVEQLRPLSPARIVIEATSNLHVQLRNALVAAGLLVSVVNPRNARLSAQASGRLAKTDRIDALALAEFAAEKHQRLRLAQPHDPELDALRSLVTRRQQLVEMRAAERNRTHTASGAAAANVRETVAFLSTQIRSMERQIASTIRRRPDWRAQDARLRSVPGVGAIVSSMLLAQVTELDAMSGKEAAKLIGVAPLNNDSGRYRGRRCVWGGRAPVRAMLYMATVTATRRNPAIRAMYLRLRAAGKPPKVVLTACMHKLVTILNAIARHRTTWLPLPETA